MSCRASPSKALGLFEGTAVSLQCRETVESNSCISFPLPLPSGSYAYETTHTVRRVRRCKKSLISVSPSTPRRNCTARKSIPLPSPEDRRVYSPSGLQEDTQIFEHSLTARRTSSYGGVQTSGQIVSISSSSRQNKTIHRVGRRLSYRWEVLPVDLGRENRLPTFFSSMLERN